MKIYIIRHGITMANEKKLYCGKTDLPLTPKGVEGLNILKEADIYPRDVQLYYTSGLLRTKETLRLIYGNVKAMALPNLNEFNFGDFEMKSYDDLKDQQDYQRWITDETGLVPCPQGDSKEMFARRVTKGYNQILHRAKNKENSLVVCHGGVIAHIMEGLFPGRENFYGWQPSPGHGYGVSYANEMCAPEGFEGI